MTALASKRAKFGIVGGLGAIGGADLLLKIIKSTPAGGDHEQLDISLEQHPFDDPARSLMSPITPIIASSMSTTL